VIQILTKEQAKERGLYTTDPVTGKEVPFTAWRIELTPEQQAEHQRMLDAGEIQF